MGKQYTRNTWVNGAPPAINDTNLNNVETGVQGNNRLDLSVDHNITTDANYTLTSDQNEYGRIEISDTGVVLTSARDIIMDGNEHTFLFVNSTAQDLTVKNATGTGITVTSGTAKELRNDGTNVIDYEGVVTTTGVLSVDNMIHVQDQKTSGTSGGANASGNNTRTLNTVISNTISGASLSSSRVTLPAGDYIAIAEASCYRTDFSRLYIRNFTDSTDIASGVNGISNSSNLTEIKDHVRSSKFTLGSSKAIELKHYLLTVNSEGFGRANSTGEVEVYADLQIYKVG